MISFSGLMWVVVGVIAACVLFFAAPRMLGWVIRDKRGGIWRDDSRR